MTDEEFEQLVAEGIDSLPTWTHEKMKNLAFVIADEPNEDQRVQNHMEEGDTLFGLYEGVPLSERGMTEEIMLPDKITVFKNSILAAYQTPEDIRACVHNTVWHEVAHFFGHDEEWVEQEEIRRGKTL